MHSLGKLHEIFYSIYLGTEHRIWSRIIMLYKIHGVLRFSSGGIYSPGFGVFREKEEVAINWVSAQGTKCWYSNYAVYWHLSN